MPTCRLLPPVFLLVLLLPGLAPAEPRPGNRLAEALSPYLQSHAGDPVDWYPWGPEALQRAREEDRPIFLSVGYSTCYWCYVMGRDVFSDPEIAALMNRWFVNVLVDREERPDVDQVYMTAAELLSGEAGWPNSVFLTPEAQPFFAGTHFPARETDQAPGFPQVLRNMHEAWQVRRAEVIKVAARVTAALRELAEGQPASPMAPDSVLVSRALAGARSRYDEVHGGFGEAPKFPPFVRLHFLLSAGGAGEAPHVPIVEHTLEAMAQGAISDQVGGGFHRYALDAAWNVPHFEKLLCTQAQAAVLYLEAYRSTGRPEFGRAAARVLHFVERELTAPNGALYTAVSSHVAGVDGQFYVWTEDELGGVLGADLEDFRQAFALQPLAGKLGGALHARAGMEETAARLGLPSQEAQERVDAWLRRLFEARALRPRPALDDKVLTAWNGMMISALSLAQQVLGDPRYGRSARRAAAFLLGRMRTGEGGLLRVYRHGVAGGTGQLEDYACLAQGLVDLYQATGTPRWLRAAEDLAEQMMARFRDARFGGFYLTEAGDDLPVRSRSGQDGALPAPTAMAVHVLLDLASFTGQPRYRQAAETALHAAGSAMHASPATHTHLVAAAARYLRGSGPAPVPGRSRRLRSAGGDTLVQASASVDPARPVPGHSFRVAVRLRIRPGWHITASACSSRWAIPTTLGVEADLPIHLVEVDYPAGRPLPVAATGETLEVYSDSVALQAAVRLAPEAAAGQEGHLWLQVRYQACDASRCLPPAALRHPVPLQVAR
ncbi:MAG: DUF255 domain-containing protein [Candidatus Latescibacterota bacterium]